MKITVDNTACVIDSCESDTFKKIRDYFSYVEENKYNKYKGKEIKYLVGTNGKFMTGLLVLLVKFLNKNNIYFEFDDCRSHVDIHFTDVSFMYPHLQEIYKMKMFFNVLEDSNGDQIPFNRGILNLATNAGKSYLMDAVAHTICGHTLILVHTDLLYRQTIEHYESKGVSVNKVGNGVYTYRDNYITVAKYKTLYNKLIKSNHKDLNYLWNVECVIVDECHKAGADLYAKLLLNIDSYFNFFFSGTSLQGKEKGNRFRIVGLSGGVLARIDAKDLFEKEISLNIEVKLIDCDQMIVDYNYPTLYKKAVVNSNYRNTLISNYVSRNPEEIILISVDRIQHAKNLKQLIPDSEIFTGKDSDLNKIILFKEGSKKVLITTKLREGLNMPLINTLIVAQAGKNTVAIKQLVGRIMRKDGINTTAKVIDIYDTGNTILEKQSDYRLALYNEEGYTILS